MTENKPLTHTAWAMKREGRTASRPLEIGCARIEDDGKGHHRVYLDRLPIGGFDGRVFLAPIGASPPESKPEPQRPVQSSDGAEEEEELG
jgi:hypothetical protein